MTMRYDIAIIGAGPAGIGIAVEARFAGIPKERVLVLEKDQNPCWSLRTQYPENKLVTANYKGYHNVVHDGVMRIVDMTKPESLSYFADSIDSNDLNIRFGETVSGVRRDHDGFIIITDKGEFHCRICVVAMGILGKPNRPEYKIPRTVRVKVHFNGVSTVIADSDILVVGGGDTAAERAVELFSMNNRVTLSYRAGEFHRMTDDNRKTIERMEKAGEITILRNSNIVKVEREGVRPKITFAEPENSPMVFDRIFYCLGGNAPVGFLKETGIEFDVDLPVLSDRFETSVPGLFLAGDLTAGTSGGSINWAFSTARKSMTYIAESYLADVAAGA
ncbi:MAG: NAD(P)-binding domain-containing protein [candidate division Zixibacteria bacterium]